VRCVVKCSVCNLPLTEQLSELASPSMLASDLEKDRAPAGFFGIEHGHFITNSQDIINTRRHPDVTRLQGCCGPSGGDGMNLVCLNGHEVGTEHSDCTVAHSITFDRSACWLDRIWV